MSDMNFLIVEKYDAYMMKLSQPLGEFIKARWGPENGFGTFVAAVEKCDNMVGH